MGCRTPIWDVCAFYRIPDKSSKEDSLIGNHTTAATPGLLEVYRKSTFPPSSVLILSDNKTSRFLLPFQRKFVVSISCRPLQKSSLAPITTPSASARIVECFSMDVALICCKWCRKGAGNMEIEAVVVAACLDCRRAAPSRNCRESVAWC
ncbi:hypothetical protein BC830DRAFT_119966 [Chytriomyces sp. MP71]|nr:hypothetical protein BC830DRAFT_119966 [Chytriomyces sp. MP71]